ncbi:hypothetical protein FRC11_002717, partial [Ceratobasidium sp. 423]
MDQLVELLTSPVPVLPLCMQIPKEPIINKNQEIMSSADTAITTTHIAEAESAPETATTRSIQPTSTQ